MTGITDVAYRPSLSAPIGMDVLDTAELRSRGRHRALDLAAPQRPAFHHLIHVPSDGTPLPHTVDFSDYVIEPGGWLRVRPGQVHQYARGSGAAGHEPPADSVLVIWQPGFVPAEPPHERDPLVPKGPHADAVELALRHLTLEHADLASIPLDAHLDTLRMLLSVLLLRLAHAGPAGTPAARPDGPFRRFEAAVERDFPRTHRVADYAAALGYSPRTLTRATQAATGRTAKTFLDDRVLLEARRMLVHTDAPASDIGRRLGFRDPGDFSKFFRSRDGRTPLTFRGTARGEPAHIRRGPAPPR
ncbi:helix-turn-helix transcriptional regulator [Streptomyces sp. NBC_01187]|uniref:helix-turn-helix transcriptional regulator n=1 Tax=Streptomyces sp. NBC_01187 TaxID=2903766 RepID=UPI00386C0046|nr:helix-turn-helix transcriptional regulator [Streptomyces sp. NBC_01187]